MFSINLFNLKNRYYLYILNQLQESSIEEDFTLHDDHDYGCEDGDVDGVPFTCHEENVTAATGNGGEYYEDAADYYDEVADMGSKEKRSGNTSSRKKVF